MKRIFKFAAVAAAVMALCVCMCVGVSAATTVASGTCGANGDNLTWMLDDSGTLTISGEGEMRNWTDSYRVPWSNYVLQIKTVVMGGGVTSIGSRAFSSCNSMTSMTIGDSVTSIGERAFEFCGSLTSVTIPENVTSIGSNAFSSCISLTSVYITDLAAWCNIEFYDFAATPLFTNSGNLYVDGVLATDIVIPDCVTSIGNYIFYGCSSLTSVTITDSVTSIGESAFGNCDSLTSITIPDSVTGIGDSAFGGCNNLKRATIGDSVVSIGEYAFSGCRSLTRVTIGDSVTSIGKYAFNYCTSLTNVHITDLAAWCNIAHGNTYSNPLNFDSANLYIDGILATDIVIPDCVTSIGNYIFYGCSSLTSVIIGGNVTGIGESAFENCDSLTSITITDSVTSIGESAFETCDSLTSITIPDNVTSIGEWSFAGCSNLTNATIYSHNAEFGSGVFTDNHTDFTIHAYAGSTAETYATANAHNFVALDEPTDENDPIISISQAESGVGEIVKVDVILKNNPGITVMRLGVNYDTDVLTLLSVDDGGLLGAEAHSDKISTCPYTLCWVNGSASENFIENGVIATLTFRVPKDAANGVYPISIEYGENDILDVDINTVEFAVTEGAVSVITRTPGDASGDGKTDMIDVIYLARYVASWSGFNEEKVKVSALDLNLDGKVNSIDLIILARHLANWSGYETLPLANIP